VKKPSVEELKLNQRLISKAYEHIFITPEGKKVLHDLERMFSNRSSVKVPKETGVVDIHRTLVNEGAREVVLYIHNRIKGGESERLDNQ